MTGKHTRPALICHDILYQDKRIGTAWARASVQHDQVAIECHLIMMDVPAIGLRGFKKRSTHRFAHQGRPLKSQIEDSVGNTVNFIYTSEGFRRGDRDIPLPQPLAFIVEPNQFSLTAHQLVLHGRENLENILAFIPDSGTAVPLSIVATAEGLQNSFGERTTLDPDGVIGSVAFANPDMTVKRARRPEPRWPRPLAVPRFLYTPPEDLAVEDVEIAEESYEAEATISRPLRENEARAVALFIGGTGAYTRHGFTPQIDIGTHQLLDDLARNNIASLRYDKFDRRALTPEERFGNRDFDTLCGDAARWLD